MVYDMPFATSVLAFYLRSNALPSGLVSWSKRSLGLTLLDGFEAATAWKLLSRPLTRHALKRSN